jgi:hypothetical protein
MAYTTINKPNEHFDIKLWTGNGSTQTISGLSFQPDLVWGKSRSTNYEQSWIDSVRGGTKYLFSNGTSAESTDANAITAFNSDGYDLGSSPYIGNANAVTYVGWNWLGGGTAVSNTDGTITSSVSANTTAGFSIVSYTGNGSTNQTTGHGLGVTPSLKIVKNRDGATDWAVTGSALGTTGNILALQDTRAIDNQPAFFPADSSTTIGLSGSSSGSSQNSSGSDYIAYCFAEKKGFSKFGSYVGNNGGTDGVFVYTGFKPALVIQKLSSNAGGYWIIKDSKRSPYNGATAQLEANTNDAEETNHEIDFLSNGFKTRANGLNQQDSGYTYIYMAFAENPLVGTNNVPATAR